MPPRLGFKKAFGQSPEGLFSSSSLFLLAASALLLFPALSGTPFRRAEIYFADAARAMVERGDWLIPYFRGQPFFDKPPLTYWLMAASFELFGFSTGIARIGLALTAVLVIFLTVWLAHLLWQDGATALTAGWILLATVSFTAFGRTAMSDMLLALWTTLAVTIAVAAYRGKISLPVAIVAAGFTLGLGFATKGPIALLIPVLAGFYPLWKGWRKRPPLPLKSVGLAIVLFLAVALGWYVFLYLRLGSQPLYHFFIRENLQRFSGAEHSRGAPAWFYLTTYLGQGLPWSLFLPGAIVLLVRRQPDPAVKAMLFWMLLVGLVLTMSSGKLDYYLLPLYPPAALVVARYAQVASWNGPGRALATTLLVLVVGVLLALPFILFRLPSPWRPQGMALAATCMGLAAGGLWCLARAFRPNPLTTTKALVFAVSVAFAVANTFVLPAFYSAQPNTALMAAISRERSAHPDIVVAAGDDPLQVHRDLLFESRLVLKEASEHELAVFAGSKQRYLLLVKPPEAALLRTQNGIRELGSFSYLPAGVFTFRGIFSGMEPEQLILLANFTL